MGSAHRNAWFLMALMGASLVAGCAGSGSDKTGPASGAGGSASPSNDPNLGSIEGTVMNEEVLPVPQARVDLVGRNRFTVTNVNGFFRFTHLEPGRYQLDVRVGDLDPFRAEAGVSAGQTTKLDIKVTLDRPIENVPYVVTTITKGYMGCNVNGEKCPGYPSGNDKQRFNHTFEGRPVAFLYEVTWKRPGPGPPNVGGPSPIGYPFNDTSQPGWIHRWELQAQVGPAKRTGVAGPPYLRTNLTIASTWAIQSPVAVQVRSYPAGFLTLPGMAYEQDYTLYLSSFYVLDNSRFFCGPANDDFNCKR